jgi:hypothetical protein
VLFGGIYAIYIRILTLPNYLALSPTDDSRDFHEGEGKNLSSPFLFLDASKLKI